ncbi:hypothetical protein YC2023_036678 [Brassica napus]
MPGLAHRDEHYSSGFWSKDVDGVSYNQLHKFWSELSPEARHELLRIDRHALFEQARKNMCCSKCIGLLLEDFSQIVSNGKSLQQKGDLPCNRSGALKDGNHKCIGELHDPAVDQWGGLTATRDGLLTVPDCYLYAKSFKGLQNVFESARARERKRELLYPHACGSRQGMVGYAFWSALEEETRLSLSRMKEEDFIERLTNRFKCKKFCKDCRRNVIREFKELKELKRMQREPQCTDWFCVADTAIHYEVDNDSVRADWSQYFKENDGYQYIEWAIGTEEWETDILKYKYVGNDGSAQVNGLDLRGLHQCYITVRAFKDNGRCSEVSVKAHALRGQQCVHSWLVVGDGFVSVKRGECLRTLFEHAEDVEEQEDEVLVDKDGNEVGGECLRPQKHAKTPELAREFLLDAAAVIFMEQVEKAYRESTARQNAHSMFVSLSSKLLEQRVHIACKEIVTLENQTRLLEEEEKEEEKKERKRRKEREKKLRRKKRLKEKEREKEQKNPKFSNKPVLPREEDGFLNLDEEMNTSVSCEEESATETGDVDEDLSPPDDDQDGWKRVIYNKGRQEVITHYCVREVIIDDEDGKGCFTTKEGKKMEEVGIRQKKNDDMYLKDPMMSRASSSDNCSSCLSEEDSNGNTESHSMSDSEDVSQHSEGRENLVFTENDCHEKMTENNISNLPGENMVPSVDTGSCMSQPQSMMFPKMPVFKAPGYYHQAPVSLSADPANRLIPFPHAYTDPLGYGTTLNHSATPFFNSGPAPVFHPYAAINTVDQVQTLEPLEAADERRDMETPSSRGPQTKSVENFSLFHFGGPIALSTGSKSGDYVFGDLAGSCKKKKKESIVGEEYFLFAKRNSLRFSIF